MATIKIKNTEGNWENVAVATQMKTEPIVLSDNQSYGCVGTLGSKYIELFGDTISTKNLTNLSHMFQDYKNDSIPFDINVSPSSAISLEGLFFNCKYLKVLPKILGNFVPNNFKSMFQNCYNLREIPEDYFDNINFEEIKNSTSVYDYNAAQMFYECWSLRNVPIKFLSNMNPSATYSYNYFYNSFTYNYNLDELIDLPVPYVGPWNYNGFGGSFISCSRLKGLTFETNEDGAPKTVKWKNQSINLVDGGIGYLDQTYKRDFIILYNSGITADKEVKDDATYQALKNDPDWFSQTVEYSRYNHDSAVETINSLPDTSAYLATAGGTNTIKFKGASGSSTDGGAISNLTEAEIAVATAKGWTVTLS